MFKRNVGLWSILFSILFSELVLLVSVLHIQHIAIDNHQELIDEKKETPENDSYLKKIFPLKCNKIFISSETINSIKNFKKITIYHSDHIIPVLIPPPNGLN
jgi:hypothetical protein